MKIVDVCSGIGGFSLAGRWIGWETLIFCEIEDFPRKVLQKNFPGIKIHDDLKTLTKEIIQQEMFKQYGYYDSSDLILTAGIPCQPFSHAGKRQGTDDPRHLWPTCFEIISSIRPRWTVIENVAGLKSMENGRTLDRILTNLEDIGYHTETFLIPACSVGAWHRRDRIWIVAHNDSIRCNNGECPEQEPSKGRSEPFNRNERLDKNVSNTSKQRLQNGRGTPVGESRKIEEPERQSCKSGGTQDVPDSISERGRSRTTGIEDASNVRESPGCKKFGLWDLKPRLGGMASRLPDWLVEPPGIPRVATGVKDRVNRLKGLGNAVVPMIPYQIFKAIEAEI